MLPPLPPVEPLDPVAPSPLWVPPVGADRRSSRRPRGRSATARVRATETRYRSPRRRRRCRWPTRWRSTHRWRRQWWSRLPRPWCRSSYRPCWTGRAGPVAGCPEPRPRPGRSGRPTRARWPAGPEPGARRTRWGDPGRPGRCRRPGQPCRAAAELGGDGGEPLAQAGIGRLGQVSRLLAGRAVADGGRDRLTGGGELAGLVERAHDLGPLGREQVGLPARVQRPDHRTSTAPRRGPGRWSRRPRGRRRRRSGRRRPRRRPAGTAGGGCSRRPAPPPTTCSVSC